MAEFWSNNDRSYYIRLWVDQVSQDTVSNSSQVRVRLALTNGANTFAEYNCTASVTIDGQTINWSGRPSMLSQNSSIMLIDRTVTIRHENDGKKSFSLSATFSGGGGWSPNILNIPESSFTLSTIPLSSSLSNNALSGNRQLGNLHTLTIDRKSSSFTHQVWYRVFGSEWIDLGKNHGTSVSFTPSLDLARHLPKSSSGLMDICVRTYNGSTQIGSDVYSNGWHFKIPDSVKPTFTGISLTDMNTVARQLLSGNDFLQIISDIQVNFNNASGAYGSTITGYRAEIVNKKNIVTEDGGHLGMMNFKGSATIRAYVVDSRGKRSDTKDITINVIEYYAPSFSFSSFRTRGNPNTLQVLRNAKIAPIMQSGKQRNVMSLTFKVAQIGNENFTDDNGSASGNFTSIHTLTNSAANMAGNYPSNKSFVIIGKLEDKFTSVEFSTTVATESVVMSYDKNGRVGIGKVAEFGKPGSLDVKGDIFVDNRPIQQYQLTNADGSLGRGSKQGSDVWGKQATEFGWRNGKYADNPIGNDWGLFQNYWLDRWKGVQFFTGVTTNRFFFRTYNNDTEWKPSQWKEIVTKDNIQSTTWQNLVLANGWNHHQQYNNVQYSKSFDGVVYLRGSANKGKIAKETVIGTLPDGFRPLQSLFVTGLNNSYGIAVLGIYSTGEIVVKKNVDSEWLNFDNISFKI